MLKVELSLRSRLVRQALSPELAAAGFLVLWDRDGKGGVAATVTLDGCENLEVINAQRLKEVKTVVLTKDADARELDEAQTASPSDIVTDDLATDAFVRSLRLTSSGEQVFPDGMVSAPKLPGAECGPNDSSLLPDEREMLSHLLEGHANKVIARHLNTSEAEVKVQLTNLLRKMRVDNRTQAVAWALANSPRSGLNAVALSGARALTSAGTSGNAPASHGRD